MGEGTRVAGATQGWGGRSFGHHDKENAALWEADYFQRGFHGSSDTCLLTKKLSSANTARARILFPDAKFCHQVSKACFTQGTQASSRQPHCPCNEELKSVPLAARLEFTASPTPVFWTQNQIYGLEHSISYRKNFEMYRRKENGSWRILNISYKTPRWWVNVSVNESV